jgi:hypothetical protein
MPVKLTIDNKTTTKFVITAEFDRDALSKVGPCKAPGTPEDLEGNELIAFMLKEWCDHKASEWFAALARSATRVELSEAAASANGEVIGPSPQPGVGESAPVTEGE